MGVRALGVPRGRMEKNHHKKDFLTSFLETGYINPLIQKKTIYMKKNDILR